MFYIYRQITSEGLCVLKSLALQVAQPRLLAPLYYCALGSLGALLLDAVVNDDQRATFKVIDQESELQQQTFTAGIISLLTHTCIYVALHIVVHPQLTHAHQSSYH